MPDVKPPSAVLLFGGDLRLLGPASVLMNSIPIVTQLDIFEPRQETERCRRGSPGRSTSNHPGLARQDWRLRHEED